MIVSFWNIRGLNLPLKQNGVLKHVRKNKVAIMGLLETKLNQQSLRNFISRRFKNWRVAENFQHNPNGRILIIWQEDRVDLEIMEITNQTIHCLATCKSTSIKFSISFIYAFNTIVGRRPLWENLHNFNASLEHPWLLLGDFNSVLSSEEKSMACRSQHIRLQTSKIAVMI